MRLKFPEDEQKQAVLLDAYAVIDEGISLAIREDGRGLACRKGCGNCCRQSDIPVYPHELAGIYRYSAEKLKGPTREVLKGRLKGPIGGCLFLMEDSCLIHPVRPASCRQFNVFGKPCEEGEDPFFTRRQDVLTPKREYTLRAFSLVASFYGIGSADPLAAEEIIHTRALNLREFDRQGLARLMERHGPERPNNPLSGHDPLSGH